MRVTVKMDVTHQKILRTVDMTLRGCTRGSLLLQRMWLCFSRVDEENLRRSNNKVGGVQHPLSRGHWIMCSITSCILEIGSLFSEEQRFTLKESKLEGILLLSTDELFTLLDFIFIRQFRRFEMTQIVAKILRFKSVTTFKSKWSDKVIIDGHKNRVTANRLSMEFNKIRLLIEIFQMSALLLGNSILHKSIDWCFWLTWQYSVKTVLSICTKNIDLTMKNTSKCTFYQNLERKLQSSFLSCNNQDLTFPNYEIQNVRSFQIPTVQTKKRIPKNSGYSMKENHTESFKSGV
jgi:hypothetical protein